MDTHRQGFHPPRDMLVHLRGTLSLPHDILLRQDTTLHAATTSLQIVLRAGKAAVPTGHQEAVQRAVLHATVPLEEEVGLRGVLKIL